MRLKQKPPPLLLRLVRGSHDQAEIPCKIDVGDVWVPQDAAFRVWGSSCRSAKMVLDVHTLQESNGARVMIPLKAKTYVQLMLRVLAAIAH